MYRELTVIAMTGMMFVGAQVLAGNSRNQAALNRRHVIDCMSKRMSANKAVSYNEAAKACKDQLKTLNANLTSNPVAKQPNSR